MKNIRIILTCFLLISFLFQSSAHSTNNLELLNGLKNFETGTDYILIHFKGRKAGEIDFSGFRPSLEPWCTQLPYERDGLMFPDNFCGILVRYVNAIQWWNESGHMIGDELNITSINGSQYFLDGIKITGGLESCKNPSEWRFPYPLTRNGNPPLNATTLVMEVNYPQNTIYHPAIEFLNNSGGLMELSDLYNSEVPNKKEWLKRICGKYPDYCVEPKPFEMELTDHPFPSSHPIHRRARQLDSRPLHFPMFINPLTKILKTKDGKAQYQAFKFLGGGGNLPGISGNKMRIYYQENRRVAIEIYGKILSYWKKRKYEQGRLGYPISRIKKSNNGGYYCVFENDVVYASSRGNASKAKDTSILVNTLPKLIADLTSANQRKRKEARLDLNKLSRGIWYIDIEEECYSVRLKRFLKKRIEGGNSQRKVKIEFKDIEFKKFHRWKKSNGRKPGKRFRILEFRVKFKPVDIPVSSEFSVYVSIYPIGNSLYAKIINFDKFKIDYDILNLPVILVEFGLGSPNGVKKLLWSEIKKRLKKERKIFKFPDTNDLLDFTWVKVSLVATHPQENGAVRIYFAINKNS